MLLKQGMGNGKMEMGNKWEVRNEKIVRAARSGTTTVYDSSSWVICNKARSEREGESNLSFDLVTWFQFRNFSVSE